MKLDIQNGNLVIAGNSYPANSTEFYMPIIDWYEKKLKENSLNSIKIEFYYNYINTSSTKLVIHLLDLLEPFYSAGGKCQIYWHHDAEDVNIRDIGQDLRNYVNIPFELVPHE